MQHARYVYIYTHTHTHICERIEDEDCVGSCGSAVLILTGEDIGQLM